MIVTAHQPNYLPGMSVIEKIMVSDAVIWLDDVQFSRGGFTNRNRMPDGSWLTVPIKRDTAHGPIRSVEINYEKDWVKKHQRRLRQHYGEYARPLEAILERRPRLLATLNLNLINAIWPHYVPSYLQTDLSMPRIPISDQLAWMTYYLGGDVYLSGPSGRNYLDLEPFARRGIEVRFHESAYAEVNPCSAILLTLRSKEEIPA